MKLTVEHTRFVGGLLHDLRSYRAPPIFYTLVSSNNEMVIGLTTFQTAFFVERHAENGTLKFCENANFAFYGA